MLYDRIVQNEIKMEADGLFTRATHKGWLDKLSTTNKWQRRWFVLKNNCLYYFLKPEDEDPRVIIPLEGVLVRGDILVLLLFISVLGSKSREPPHEFQFSCSLDQYFRAN